MNNMSSTDETLSKILGECGSIAAFLSLILSFLKRDIKFGCSQKIETGNLKQQKEEFCATFERWENESEQRDLSSTARNNVGHNNPPPAVAEIEVETENEVLQIAGTLQERPMLLQEQCTKQICNSTTSLQENEDNFSSAIKRYKYRAILPKCKNSERCQQLLTPSNLPSDTSIVAVTIKTRRSYKCSECAETFISFRQLKAHESKHVTYIDGINICNYCCSLYANSETLEKHIQDWHANGKYLCLPCGKTYKSRGQLLKHVHSDIHNASALLYYCSLCPRSGKSFVEFTTRARLQQHYQEMHLLMPTNQEEDDVEIEMNEEFLDEFLLHNANENSFHFSDCWDALDLHLPDMLHLPVTEESTSDEQNLQPTKDAFKCPKCYESCVNQKILLQHMAHKHSLQVLICGKCELSFQDYAQWVQHKSTHRQKTGGDGTDKNQLQCSVCEKTFRSNAALNYHEKIHSRNSLRPHSCPYCGKCFRTDVNFKQHLRIVHSQTKRHICELCDKQFATLDHLKKHVLSQHQNERKHICHVCAKRFTQLSHLKQHLSIHTTGKTLKCISCEAMFWRKIDLERHTLSKHN